MYIVKNKYNLSETNKLRWTILKERKGTSDSQILPKKRRQEKKEQITNKSVQMIGKTEQTTPRSDTEYKLLNAKIRNKRMQVQKKCFNEKSIEIEKMH